MKRLRAFLDLGPGRDPALDGLRGLFMLLFFQFSFYAQFDHSNGVFVTYSQDTIFVKNLRATLVRHLQLKDECISTVTSQEQLLKQINLSNSTISSCRSFYGAVLILPSACLPCLPCR